MVRKTTKYRTVEISFQLSEDEIREAVAEYVLRKEPTMSSRTPFIFFNKDLDLDATFATVVFSKRFDDEEKVSPDNQGS